MSILRIVYILFTPVAFLCLVGCQGGEQRPISEVTGKETPDQELWGSTVILSVKGKSRAKVWAKHILKFEESHIIKMDGHIKVDFYDEHGNHVSALTAAGGEVDESSQDLKAVGNVVVISDAGSHLETERLQWHNSTQRIISDTLVTIRSGDEEVAGMGFESDANLEHWEIKENVTGVVKRRIGAQE